MLTPLFVFDQFEEVFTLGASNAARGGPAANRSGGPDRKSHAREPGGGIQENESAGAGLALDNQRYKVLLSFREDFLAAIEGWKREIPSIMRNRLRLLPMSGEQAFEAVNKTAPHLAPEPIARRIVSFVAAAGEDSGESTAELEVAPALLSLVCHGLNERRKEQGKAQFDEALLTGNGTGDCDGLLPERGGRTGGAGAALHRAGADYGARLPQAVRRGRRAHVTRRDGQGSGVVGGPARAANRTSARHGASGTDARSADARGAGTTGSEAGARQAAAGPAAPFDAGRGCAGRDSGGHGGGVCPGGRPGERAETPGGGGEETCGRAGEQARVQKGLADEALRAKSTRGRSNHLGINRHPGGGTRGASGAQPVSSSAPRLTRRVRPRASCSLSMRLPSTRDVDHTVLPDAEDGSAPDRRRRAPGGRRNGDGTEAARTYQPDHARGFQPGWEGGLRHGATMASGSGTFPVRRNITVAEEILSLPDCSILEFSRDGKKLACGHPPFGDFLDLETGKNLLPQVGRVHSVAAAP